MAKLTKKLLLSYLMIVVLMGVLGISAITTLKSVNENSNSMYNDRVIPLGLLSEISKYSENTRVQMVTSVNTKNADPTKIAEENILRMTEFIQEYEDSQMSAEEEKVFTEFKTNWNSFTEIVANNISLVRNGQFGEANEGLKKGGIPFNAASDELHKLIQVNKEIAEQILEENNSEFVQSRLFLFIIIGLAILLAVAIGLVVGRIITQPIIKIADRAHQIAKGDLTGEDNKVKNKDEIGELASSFNEMINSLRDVVSIVTKSSDELMAVSEEMAASSEEVAASAVEVSTSMNEVAENTEIGNQSVVDVSKVLLELSSLIQIAKGKATTALRTSETTYNTATDGKEIVNHSIKKMELIRKSTVETEELIQKLDKYSQEIGHITQMITSIADQTNLLALNASIEAARAGEHGKGFAVVADEVRKLAEQSNDGANQVAELVKKISGGTGEAVQAMHESKIEVDQGVSIVASAGHALDRILMDVKDTMNVVSSITNVTDEEVASSEKIVALIGELSTVMENTAASTQEVASSTQETTAAMETVSGSAEEVSAMAEELQSAVHIFKI